MAFGIQPRTRTETELPHPAAGGHFAWGWV